MATKIRLTRIGAKSKPYFQIVVQDKRVKRNGKVIEVLGFYDPQKSPLKLVINRERINWWRGRGAQLSAAARKLVQE